MAVYFDVAKKGDSVQGLEQTIYSHCFLCMYCSIPTILKQVYVKKFYNSLDTYLYLFYFFSVLFFFSPQALYSSPCWLDLPLLVLE